MCASIINQIKIIRIPYWFKISKGFISPQSIVYFIKYVKNCDLVLLNIPNFEGGLLALIPEIYQKRIIIGMSDNPQNEEHWRRIENWQTFIYKGSEIANQSSNKNLAELVYNRIKTQIGNPSLYILENGIWLRSIGK